MTKEVVKNETEMQVVDSKALVSIIIPAYNTEKYMRKCLDSVVNQTYTNLEIIVTNDASTDTTLDIIQEFAHQDSRIKVVNNITNKGNGIGRNSAIKMATGEYILFVDSDDYIKAHTVEKMLEAILQSNVEVAVLGHVEHGDKEPKSEKKKIVQLPEITGKESKEEIFKLFLLQFNGIIIQPWSYFVKKEFLINNNIFFDESGIYFEDIIFTTKLLYFTSGIVPVKEVLYHYIRRKSSITNTQERKTIESRMHALMSVKAFLKEQNVFGTYKDCYTLFFVRSGFLTSMINAVQMPKRDKEVEQFLFQLSREKFIQHFNIKQLNLPDETLRGPFVQSYKKTQDLTLACGRAFYFFIRYGRFMKKIRNIFLFWQ